MVVALYKSLNEIGLMHYTYKCVLNHEIVNEKQQLLRLCMCYTNTRRLP